MTNTKKFLNFALLLLSFCGLFLCGCDLTDIFGDNGKITDKILEAPQYLKIITTDNTEVEYFTKYDNLALIVNENPDALGYAFYVYGGNGDYNDLTVYTRFLSDSNSIELKNIFGSEEGKLDFEQKIYYFYAVALGGESNDILIKDSSHSPIRSIKFKLNLEKPVLSINAREKILGWTAISDCKTYEIWEGADKTNLSQFEKIAQIENLNNVNTFDFSEYYEDNFRDLHFMLKAIADKDSFFIDSEFSLVSTYDSKLTLYNPSNIQINENTLSWEQVENASSYVVIVDSINEFPVTTNSFDLSFLLNEAGSHSITVKSKTTIQDIVINETIQTVYKDVYVKLGNVSNVSISQQEKMVNVTFDKPSNARDYTVMVNDTPLYSALTENSFSYSIEGNYSLNNTLKFSIKANAYGFYTESGVVESDTFSFKQYLKTPVIKNINGKTKKMVIEITLLDKKLAIYNRNALLCTYDIPQNNTATSPMIDMSNYFEDYEEYIISIASLSYNDYTVTSEKSLGYTFANELPFASPEFQSINLSSNGAYIILKWNQITNATEYNIYVNDNFYVKTNTTQYQILKSDLTEIAGGGYNFNIQAVAGGGYLDSVLGQNTYYKGYDGLSEPTGITLTKSTNGFLVSWDEVNYADSYTLFVDNEKIELNNNAYEYVTTEERPYQIVIKACTEIEDDCSYSDKKMINLSSSTIPGYTNRYIYFDGWQDFYVTTEKEFYTLCKYLFYKNVENETMTMYINSDVGINSSTFNSYYQKASQDFGTNSLSLNSTFRSSVMSNIEGYIVELTINYLDGTKYPATTSTNSSYSCYNEQKLYSKPQTRSNDYNDFACEKSMIEVSVSNTNELCVCIEGGAKPVFANVNYQAEETYNKAKEILRKIISDDMTDFEKSLAIYDYINSTSVYDSFYNTGTFNDRRYWANGPLLGNVGVCDGLSKAYSLLCNMEGILTKKINGFTLENSGIEKYQNGTSLEEMLPTDIALHAWNKIYLDADNDGNKEWLNLDLTWDGGSYYEDTLARKNYELSTHKYFLLSDAEFSNHFAYFDDYVANTSFNYYENYEIDTNGNDLNITTIEELRVYLNMLRTNESIYNGRDIFINVESKTISEAITLANISTGMQFNYIAIDNNTCMIFKIKN